MLEDQYGRNCADFSFCDWASPFNSGFPIALLNGDIALPTRISPQSDGYKHQGLWTRKCYMEWWSLAVASFLLTVGGPLAGAHSCAR